MLEIQADYSLTAQSDYRRVATRLIERTRKLNIFLHYPRCCNWYNLSILGTTVGPTGCVQSLTAFPNGEYWALSDMKYTLLHISSGYGYHFTFESSRPWWCSGAYAQRSGYKSVHYDFQNTSSRSCWSRTHTFIPRETQWSAAAAAAAAVVLRSCCGRRQFVIERGEVGIGPAAT